MAWLISLLISRLISPPAAALLLAALVLNGRTFGLWCWWTFAGRAYWGPAGGSGPSHGLTGLPIQ